MCAVIIIELEILEQIADDDPWPLSKVIEFVCPHKEPWTVVAGLYRDGCLVFLGTNSEELKSHQVNEVLREKNEHLAGVFVAVTDKGLKRAFGDNA